MVRCLLQLFYVYGGDLYRDNDMKYEGLFESVFSLVEYISHKSVDIFIQRVLKL